MNAAFRYLVIAAALCCCSAFAEKIGKLAKAIHLQPR
jgi:hypothetical protein